MRPCATVRRLSFDLSRVASSAPGDGGAREGLDGGRAAGAAAAAYPVPDPIGRYYLAYPVRPAHPEAMQTPDAERRPERTAYLPPRAAKARKLILRTQLGLPWLLAATAVAGVILVAGVLLLVRGGRPGSPWVAVAAVTAFPAGSVTEVEAPGAAGHVVVVDRRGGDLRAFVGPEAACPLRPDGPGFRRGCTGQAWDADGAPRTPGTPALARVTTRFARGDLYVDPGSHF
jgi:hypothetical protein